MPLPLGREGRQIIGRRESLPGQHDRIAAAPPAGDVFEPHVGRARLELKLAAVEPVPAVVVGRSADLGGGLAPHLHEKPPRRVRGQPVSRPHPEPIGSSLRDLRGRDGGLDRCAQPGGEQIDRPHHVDVLRVARPAADIGKGLRLEPDHRRRVSRRGHRRREQEADQKPERRRGHAELAGQGRELHWRPGHDRGSKWLSAPDVSRARLLPPQAVLISSTGSSYLSPKVKPNPSSGPISRFFPGAP